jgi:hypothetical protein
METERIVIDRTEARALFRKYREHRHWSEPIDKEIQRTYQLIARGEVIIKALDAVVKAGVGEDGLPKLAICRADATTCFLDYRHDGGARMAMDQWPPENHRRRYLDFAPGSFPVPPPRKAWRAQAMVPLIPIDIRPRRGIENYHVLFEAIWAPMPPSDPMLVRRIGEADLWVVVAAWELTEIERAVLAARVA